jgi:hypothetical protein
MDQPITLQQLIVTAIMTVITALAPQIYNIYARRQDSKDKEKEQESEGELRKVDQKLTETEKLYREWENVVNGYIKQIESLRYLETQNAELRPLVLKVALIQQENKQIKDDKEDWKDYADKLTRQLETHGIIPIPFRRTPRDGDTEEKMKTISRKMKTVQEEIESQENGVTATTDTPTIIHGDDEAKPPI